MQKNIPTLLLVTIFLFLSSCTPTLLNLADDRLLIGDYSGAADLYKEYLQQQPNSQFSKRKLAYALLKSGKTAEAAVRFERILDESPDDSFATLYLGLTYLHLGKTDKALATWENYQSGESSEVAAEIKKQVKHINDLKSELSDEFIAEADLAITAAVDEDRARNAYNLWRLGDCG
jgi:tetratricopeptide (TPR) repeat protein